MERLSPNVDDVAGIQRRQQWRPKHRALDPGLASWIYFFRYVDHNFADSMSTKLDGPSFQQ